MGRGRRVSRDKRAKVIDLREGPGDGVRIPIEPINRNIVYAGQRYFRMDNVTHHPEGEPIGQCYLWDGYWTERFAAQLEDSE